MVKIILILALLQYISNFIFGYKSRQLFCGIFGMATDTPEKLEVNAVHILGIYNIERGKMSCGLSWDGDTYYGLGAEKLYTDFIIDREIKPIKTPIMIGHTRQPSYGMAITEDNAHPFGFGANKENDSFGMIFCHNGTLKNHKELAKKYDIDLSEKVIRTSYNNHTYETTRDKIDSEILGEILFKTKTFHVLSEYIGAAALAWTWIDEPNKLYLWSGASKTVQDSTLGKEVEERPMNVYCKDENTMFFSSISDSLTVLGASRKDDLQIDYNTVYIITDGDFANAEKHKVSRLKAGQSEAVAYQTQSYVSYPSYKNYKNAQYCDWDAVQDNRSFIENKEVDKVFSMTNLHEDKPLKAIVDYNGKVYSKSLRYWKNGVLINDVYVYIKGWGFKHIGTDYNNAIQFMNIIKDAAFNINSGSFEYNVVDKSKYFIPFPKNDNPVQFHYFIDGVLLKSLSDYKQALNLKKSIPITNRYLDCTTMSYLSKHPIISMEIVTGKSDLSTIAKLDGVNFTGNIVELGFEKIYYFNNGILSKWKKREDLITTPVISIELPFAKIVQNKELLSQAINNIEEFEKDNKDSFLPENLTEQENIKFIESLIIDTFERHSEELSESVIELSDWKDNEIVKVALETLNLITHTLKDFVEKPNKK